MLFPTERRTAASGLLPVRQSFFAMPFCGIPPAVIRREAFAHTAI